MQPEISKKLKTRKVETLEILKPDVISAGNIGCMVQIGSAIGVPVVHTVELLDWATGGPKPSKWHNYILIVFKYYFRNFYLDRTYFMRKVP